MPLDVTHPATTPSVSKSTLATTAASVKDTLLLRTGVLGTIAQEISLTYYTPNCVLVELFL
jgi:hypothetical protein